MPETRYARFGDVHLAYQTVGDGPVDVVLVGDWFGNVELMWEGAALADALRRIASFSRLIIFDKWGVGLSDPVPLDHLPSLEEWMDDVRVVMDDAESKEAVVIGVGAGGPMVMQFAASHPHRVRGLVLINSYARLAQAEDYRMGVPDALRDQILAEPASSEATATALAGPSADPRFQAWWTRYQRASASPGSAAAMRRMMWEVDVRSVLPAVQAPTLVIHRREDPWIRLAHGRYLAEHISGAELRIVNGGEDLFYLGDVDEILDEVEEFVTGVRPAARADRVLATVLFTDLVDSTRLAADLGDRRWRQVLDEHDRIVRDAIDRHRGVYIDAAGDGILATFDGPARAIRCACEVRDRLAAIDLPVRAGLHTGEIELRGSNIGGLAVHIGSRISALAGGEEIFVSSTVRDLVAGSGFRFVDLGEHDLKGVPDRWRIYALKP